MSLVRGTLVWLEPDPTPGLGREQQGRRPAVVVSDDLTNELRFVSMIAVVPVTTNTSLSTGFYPLLTARPGGLKKDSSALPDQLRSVDKGRVTGRIGTVTVSELSAIDASLRRFLGLGKN